MQQLTLPGIECVPGKVRRHGLREFHTYPLVSPGKDAAGVWGGSWRVSAAEAWTFPELELRRTGNRIPALLFDLDGDPTDGLVDVLGPALPRPNWIVWRRENLHAHIAYTLARPVLTGDQAKRTPQAFLARVGEYLAAQRPPICSLTLLTILNSVFPRSTLLFPGNSEGQCRGNCTDRQGWKKGMEGKRENDYSRFILMKA